MPILGNPSHRALTRREMLERLLGAVGANLALSGVALGHPIHKHLANLSTLIQADIKDASDWMPEFLDAQQNELFTALAERIVPGSTQAQVGRTVDLLLTVETAKNQNMFMESLTAMDREARQHFGGPFPALAATRQDEVLAGASTAKKGQEPESAAFRDHFENLKGWIVGAYYSSEIGMRELGWTDEHYFEWTGCEHEEGHQ